MHNGCLEALRKRAPFRRSLGFPPLVAALLAASPAYAASVMFLNGDVEASTEDAPSGVARVGCAPAWVELNNTTPIAQQVSVQFSALHLGSEVEHRVTLDPRERRVVSLPVPTAMLPGILTVHVASTRAEGEHPINIIPSGQERPLLVLGTPLQYESFSPAEPPGSTSTKASATYFDRRHLPDLAAAYAGARGVLLLDPSATDLDKGQRAALENYVLAGGDVVFGPEVQHDTASLDQWRASKSVPQAAGKPEALGFGRVSFCANAVDCEALTGNANVEVLTSATSRRRAGGTVEGLLPGTGRTPIGTFLIIIIVFALAIGPGNLIYARRHGRHTLLITIPLLAFATCSGIAAYGVAADGLFSTHAGAASVTMLDTERHRAATLSTLGVYAALGPSELRYSGATLDLLNDVPEHAQIDWTEGLVMRGNFIPSRTYRERAVASVGPSRARLIVTGSDVENALGGHIKGGYVQTGGRRLTIPSLAQGARGHLDVDSAHSDSALTSLVAPLTSRFSHDVIKQISGDLQDGEFIAVLSDADYMPTAGLRVTWHPSFHVVRGKVSQ